MTAPKGKRCPRCGQVKPLSGFYRRRGGRSSPYCQPCTRAAAHQARTRRQDPAAVERLRAVDRTRQRRRRRLRRQPPPGGDAA
jgi:recombinational DNA repair protein (RecF pathway)